MIRRGGRRISPLEAVIFTAASTFAAGIFVMPRVLIADAGRAGGLALLFACALAVLWAALISHYASRLPDRALGRYFLQKLPFLAYPWLVVVVAFEILITYGALAAYQDMTTAVAMPGFPGLSITIVLALGAWTGARHRLEGLARSVLVFFGSFTTLAVISFLLLLMRGSELAAVLPGPHLAIAPIVRADADSLFLFAGFDAVALVLPYQVASRRGLPHVAVGGILSGALLLLAYVVTVGMVGPNYVLTQTWPVVSALRTLVLHSFFLDRFGLVVIFAWSAILISYVAIHLWAAGEAICQMTGSERGRGWWTLGFTALIMLVSGYAGGGPVQEEAVARGVISPATLFILVGWLSAAVGLALLARRDPVPQ
ncbi:MAG: GerAB/ArcD/ProY family transporter [Thermaerobacter sp.]|nr:GerAB/ArcD/ProY family transporter [Thermaerobacter sp.]